MCFLADNEQKLILDSSHTGACSFTVVFLPSHETMFEVAERKHIFGVFCLFRNLVACFRSQLGFKRVIFGLGWFYSPRKTGSEAAPWPVGKRLGIKGALATQSCSLAPRFSP